MDLRALLFTSDGGSTATLCRLLADLGIEAEICPELLVAVGRLSTERYDAIIVDWSQETEAALLLKTAREKKALGLNLVLVPDDAAIPRALQQGANSVIKKPIDPAEAHDTLSTARDLILSRRFEQQNKESRVAALKAEAESLPELPVVQEEPAAKTGFLPQTMMQSALEAEQKVVKPEYSAPSNFQVARGPAAIEQEQEAEVPTPEPVGQKRWDEVRSVFRETSPEPTPEPAIAPRAPQDATGVFSSLPEQEESSEEPAEESDASSPPSYLVFAIVACLLIAAVLYVWAPGDSYLGKVSSAFHSFSKSSETPKPATTAEVTAPQATPQVQATEKSAEISPTPDPDETTAAATDTGPIPSGEQDSSKIQIIETKTIPKAGAQQPPKDPASDANASQPPATDQAPAPSSTGTAPEQQAAAQPPAPAPVRTPAPAPAPQNQTVPPEPRTGVIIPDSLKTSPSPAPASSLETSSVPEETSLALLIHRVDPDYPQQAMAQRLDGPVILQASIGRDGTVRDLKLVKGYFVLAKAAFDAVKQWRFKPYSPNGKAIDFQTTLTVNFKYPN
ncbi:MAG TPA: TonB family protein [Terriglobales bacterium]|nr:TonB family protein [Terriglobales bacterium]